MRKIFIKSVALLLLAVICLSALAGCHKSTPRKKFVSPVEFDTSKNYEITFWAKNESNINQVEVYQKAVSDFEALYPNIKVNLKIYTDYGRIYQDVITNISTDTTPNVCITYPDHIATYITGQEAVVPLNQLIDNPKYGLGGSDLEFDSPAKDEVISKFLDECKIGDTYYALPYMRSTEACYINKDLVESLGYTLPEKLTWDFIWEVCDAAMALGKEKSVDKNGKEIEVYKANGQTTFFPFMYKSTDNMMIQMLRQKEAGYSTATGDIEIFNDTTKDLLFEISEHTKNGAFTTFKRTGYPGNFLNAGQCIFAIDSTAGATWMGSSAPQVDISKENLATFETVVMEIPQFDTENPQMISQGPSVCIFNKEDPGEVLASWLFTQFLLTDEVQISYATIEGYIPVTSKAQNTDRYQDYLSRSGEDNEYYYNVKIDATKLLLDNIDNTFVTPVFNGSTSLRSAAGEMIENVVLATKQKKTIDDEYIKSLYAKMTSLYKLDQIQKFDNTYSPDGIEDFELIEETFTPDDLGPLPSTAIILIASIVLVWVFILSYFVVKIAKKQKKQ